jgi:hypothetical protein
VTEADQIRDVAERFLSHPGSAADVRLTIGKLPDGFNLPMPPGARLIGSLVREPGYRTDRDIEIILDAPGSGKELVEFFADALRPQGWTLRSEFDQRIGGFTSGAIGAHRMLHKQSQEIALFITARPIGDRGTEIRIRTQWFRLDREAHGKGPPKRDLIPPLLEPDGVRLRGQGGFGGDGTSLSSASAETTWTVAELETHFAGQLAKAGWNRVEGSTSGPIAWSRWSVPGEDEQVGYLFVVQGPGENQRSLWVRTDATRRSSISL